MKPVSGAIDYSEYCQELLELVEQFEVFAETEMRAKRKLSRQEWDELLRMFIDKER